MEGLRSQQRFVLEAFDNSLPSRLLPGSFRVLLFRNQKKAPADGRAICYRLIDLATLHIYLVSVIGVVCRRYHSSNVVLSENEYKHRGLMSVIRIKCKDCKTFGEGFETSPVRSTKTGELRRQQTDGVRFSGDGRI